MQRIMNKVLAIIMVVLALVLGGLTVVPSVLADAFFFSTGDPDGKMATASRPANVGQVEIESADDFVLSSTTSITSASFTGLLPPGFFITQADVEIYRVFPADSDVARTSGPPTFSTSEVPTRVNSPSDVEFLDSNFSRFTTTILAPSFTASNSVLNGINPKPNQTTGGDGTVTGEEVRFDVTLFSTPFSLPPGHYFFVPQVELRSGDFFWLSAPRPIIPPGTPFPSGSTDLQSWIRNANLDPDWLRVGTDIVGGASPPTFNGAFSLTGVTVTEPATLFLLGLGLVGAVGFKRKSRA